jgi:hypothetical protein
MSRCPACAVVIVLLVVGAGAARAQGDGEEPPIAAVLEQRVPEELAAEGVMLARRSLALQVEQVGTKLLVSLVDRTTGRVAASTKIDRLPADRDAAVATATHVVAELVAEIAARTAPAPPPVPAPAPAEPHDDRAVRGAAELRFRREAIGFDAEYTVYLHTTPERVVAGSTRRWYPYRGELRTRLEPVEFYKLIGRGDLVEEYRRRRQLMLGLTWGGTALALGSAVLGVASLDDSGAISRLGAAAVVGLGAGLSAIAIGRWLHHRPQPIDENEAKSLAEQYNARLRRRLGLSVAAHAHRRRDVVLAPYIGARDAGLVAAARF